MNVSVSVVPVAKPPESVPFKVKAAVVLSVKVPAAALVATANTPLTCRLPGLPVPASTLATCQALEPMPPRALITWAAVEPLAPALMLMVRILPAKS